MNRYNFYYGQYPTESNFDDAFKRVEEAIGNIILGITGENKGLLTRSSIPQASTAPDLNITIPPGEGYLKTAEPIQETDIYRYLARLFWDENKIINCQNDYMGNPVTPGIGMKRYIGVIAKFVRSESEEVTDFTGQKLFYRQFEGVKFEVHMSEEFSDPDKITVPEDSLLICDILIDENVSSIGIQNPLDYLNPGINEIDITRVNWIDIYKKKDFISISSGISSAGNPIILNNFGKLDFSLFPAGSIPRSSTLSIASFSSEEKSKIGADIILAENQDLAPILDNFSSTFSNGGLIKLLEGSYTLSSVSQLDNNIILSGMGEDITTITLTQAEAIFNLEDKTNIHIKNMTIIKNYSDIVIKTENLSFSTFENLKITTICHTALGSLFIKNSQNITFSKCNFIFTDYNTSPRYAIYLMGSSKISILNNIIFGPNDTSPMHLTSGIWIDTSEDITIDKNKIYVPDYGIKSQGNNTNIWIKNNEIYQLNSSGGSGGINLGNDKKIQIIGNYIKSDYYGIYADIENSIISMNIIETSSYDSIAVFSRSKYNIISNNITNPQGTVPKIHNTGTDNILSNNS